MSKFKAITILKTAAVTGTLALLLAGCSDTIYGIPKSEWATLTPQEKQQAAASTNLGKSHPPAILQIFEKKPVAPEQSAKQDIVTGNNAGPAAPFGP